MSEQPTHQSTPRSRNASCAAAAIIVGMLSGCFARNPPTSPPAHAEVVHGECELSRAVELAAKDNDISLRMAALRLLGDRGPGSSIGVIDDALADEDQMVRFA